MVIVQKNEDGYIYGLFDWDLTQDLEYMYVRFIYVQKDYNFNKVLAELIWHAHIDPRNAKMKWIYWQRTRNHKVYHRSRSIPREKFIRRFCHGRKHPETAKT